MIIENEDITTNENNIIFAELSLYYKLAEYEIEAGG